MIKRISKYLTDGLRLMASNANLMLVGVLVFVFPLAFFLVAQSFLNIANDNLITAQKREVSSVHDSLRSVLVATSKSSETVLQELIDSFAAERDNLTKLRIYEKTPEGYLVLAAINHEIIGQIDNTAQVIDEKPFSSTLSFLLFKYDLNARQLWQTFSEVKLDDLNYYIFAENDFTNLQHTINYRIQQSYFLLTFVFVFIITLAYWLSRQINWRKKYEVLSDTLSERDQFTNMIAHEFRTPLTAIKGYSSFLAESKSLTNEEKRFVENISISSERLVTLVNDFLEVARIQAGKIKIEKSQFDLRDVLEQVKNDLSHMAQEKGLAIKYDQQGVPVIMNSDMNRVTQIITNIVSNAVKYTPSGNVGLACEQSPGKITVRIMDTGTGISAEDQKKLFSPFTRVGGVDNTKITGSGLGMWITKQLVELLGGTIGVESIKGVGTHIVIVFKTDF